MNKLKKIEFLDYDKFSRKIRLRMYSSDGCTTTCFQADSPEALFKEINNFFDETLNPALKSEDCEPIHLSDINKEKTLVFLRNVLDSIKGIERLPVKEYLEERQNLIGFSVSF